MKFQYRHVVRMVSVACTLVASAGCGSEPASSNEPGLEEEVGADSSPLQKGMPGAAVGQSDYCNSPMNLCTSGEGDCDSTTQCAAGLVCGAGKLRQFGFPLVGGDACVPPQCVNRRLDAGETQIDCGGACGTVCATPVCNAEGSGNRCNTDCPCSIGQGDCDSDAACTGTLVCSNDKLRQFGFTSGGDACLPPHCSNKLMDAGETRVDCGGECGTVCATSSSGVPLGAAGNYAILAESAISTVPTSAITGHLGLSPAAASYITGFSLTRVGASWTSPQVVGSIFAADNDPPTPSNLTTAVANMHTAYTDAAGRRSPNFLNLGGGAIGGLTLAPGLYRFTSAVTVTSGVTLSGGANDVWIFQITGNLLMSAAQSMTLSGGAQAKNIFWQVAGLVDFGSSAHAEGIVLSKTAIKLGAGASINGRLLAQTQVNLSSSTVTQPAP
ncbi:MAG TPA: ice-binding family protein [Polyangiaceae bacterium]|nr:ice-binding family protein [Polyangiaceae bacterium]